VNYQKSVEKGINREQRRAMRQKEREMRRVTIQSKDDVEADPAGILDENYDFSKDANMELVCEVFATPEVQWTYLTLYYSLLGTAKVRYQES
jgi:hypothetical protein